MRSKGFVWSFRMIEHNCCLRQKDLYVNRFNGEKLQEKEQALIKKGDDGKLSIHWAMES